MQPNLPENGTPSRHELQRQSDLRKLRILKAKVLLYTMHEKGRKKIIRGSRRRDKLLRNGVEEFRHDRRIASGEVKYRVVLCDPPRVVADDVHELAALDLVWK